MKDNNKTFIYFLNQNGKLFHRSCHLHVQIEWTFKMKTLAYIFEILYKPFSSLPLLLIDFKVMLLLLLFTLLAAFPSHFS